MLDLAATTARVASCPAPTIAFYRSEAEELLRLARIGALAEEKVAQERDMDGKRVFMRQGFDGAAG